MYCDKCGHNVSTANNVVKKGNLVLSFCDHHYRKYEQNLTVQGFKRVKESPKDDFIAKQPAMKM
jgi:hypothetical protein